MLSKFKSWLTASQAKREASVFSKQELPYYKLSNEENYLTNLVKRLPLAAACISLRARKVRSTPWRIVDRKGKEVDKSNFPLLLNPNSFQSFEDLLELIIWRLDALGNAYLMKVGISGTSFRALYLLPNQRITPYAIEDSFITYYDFQPHGGERVAIEPHEMIHAKYPNPLSPLYGLGLIQQGELLLQRNLNRDSYMESFYKNGTVLSGIFSTDAASTSDEQRKRMKASINEEIGGVKNFFKTFFLWGGFKFQPVTATHRDSQDVEQSKLTRDDILAVFGVPGALLGFTDGVNFSNAEIQERVFINNTLIPLLERLEQIINTEIIKAFNKDLRFEFVKPVNENLTLKSSWVSRAFQDGIISKDEYGRLMGVKTDAKNTLQRESTNTVQV